jgi:4-diphosphocytidyl-2-C-methyl-D-erythritol kinase
VGVSTPAAFKAWVALFSGASGGTAPAASTLTLEQQTAKLNTFSHEVYSWLVRTPVISGVSAKGGNRAEAPLLDLVRTGIENDFERVVFPLYPAIRDVKRALERAGSSYASLSGSGSTVYGIFRTAGAAKKAAQQLQKDGIKAEATRTLGRKEFWK